MSLRKPFRFRQFSVSDEKSAMKVNTDAILLGAWVDTAGAESILDIGTGSGIIALMMAQRSATINAIDIDKDSFEQAKDNFQNSAWSNRLNAIHISLQEYVKNSSEKYDLIVSNPPFFSNSLKSPSHSKTLSKHDDKLMHNELLAGVQQFLNSGGRFCVILPYSEISRFKEQALIENLYCLKQFNIIPKRGKKIHRTILELIQIRTGDFAESILTIRNTDNSFTKAYIDLTKDFYLYF